MRKNLVFLIFVVFFISCKKKEKADKNDKNYNVHEEFFENGNIKAKGIVKNEKPFGWWSFYNESGSLEKKVEYYHTTDSLITNQVKYFNNGNIDYKKSTFFDIELPDTIKLGKNKGYVKYFSNSKNKDNYLLVVIENDYEGNIKLDTFADTYSNSIFGVYAHKAGEKLVKGKILDYRMDVKKINKDSSSLELRRAIKFFEKKVYVKPVRADL